MTAGEFFASEGGEVEHGGTVLQVPAGALEADGVLTIDAAYVSIDGLEVAGAVYEFGPDGTEFDVPVRISFPLARRGITSPTVWWTNREGTFEPVPTFIEGDEAVIYVDHFSSGVVVSCGPVPCVADRAVCVAPANPGDPVTTLRVSTASCNDALCRKESQLLNCDSLPNAQGRCEDPGTPNDAGCTLTACRRGFTDCDGIGSNGCETYGGCPVCGDGRLQQGESCDDGGTMSGDDCSATCQSELPCVPSGDEVCDLRDNDCDGSVDEGVREPFFLDNDGDGVGGSTSLLACEPPAPVGPGRNWVTRSEDCNDSDSSVSPNEYDPCLDGVDSDCSGIELCIFGTCGNGVVDDGEECDDGNSVVSDGCTTDCIAGDFEAEICNNLEVDDDGDGARDCADTDCTTDALCICRGQLEVCGDDIDNDCDGQTDERCSNCGDGMIDGDELCDDGDELMWNGCANDCRRSVSVCPEYDLDGDRHGLGCSTGLGTDDDPYVEAADCDETNPDVYFGAVEACGDGWDNDCDGVLDDGCGATPECGDGVVESPEQCDDGNSNNDDACANDCRLPCIDLDMDTYGENCGNRPDCDDTDRLRNSGQMEACGDSIDNDCDTIVNDGCAGVPACGDRVVQAPEACDDGNSASGDGCEPNCTRSTCVDGDEDTYGRFCAAGADCNDGDSSIRPGATEICDGVDNNCSSGTDETFNFVSDPANYGGCHNDCSTVANTVGTCDAARCVCEFGWEDADGNGANGCEASAFECGDGVREGTEACDDGNTANDDLCRNNCTVQCPDNDGDGYAGWSGQCQTDLDCNDFERLVNQGATESCADSVDNDCDGVANDGCPVVCGDGVRQGTEQCDYGTAFNDGTTCDPDCTWAGECTDADYDGFGDGPGCPYGTDCDDTRDDVNARATDVCDGVDNDCNGFADPQTLYDVNNCGTCGNVCTAPGVNSFATCVMQTEPLAGVCSILCGGGYYDADSNLTNGCEGDQALKCGDGTVDPWEVCDDGNAVEWDNCTNTCTVGPNCQDVDGDGYFADSCRFGPVEVDCDDTNADIRPGRTEDCSTPVDDNCNFRADETDFNSDANNCGSCGNVCPFAAANSSARCDSGLCYVDCFGGFQNSNGDPTDGCEQAVGGFVCGNGIPEPGEQCDDGNPFPGDGCFNCRRE